MEIVFDKKLYNLKAVKTAAKAFTGLADFRFQKNGQKIIAVLTNIDDDVKNVIGDEFANYVLALMKV